ncbi:MAG: LemA family protein [Clostridia bacterium]
MKKTGVVIGAIILVVIVILGAWGISTNNSLIKMEESMKQNQAEIDNQLKRRADLIPNLVNSVKGITSQEQKIVDSITSSREKMMTGSTEDKLNANDELTKNINLLIENYPEIKSDKAFVSLMDEISGTENRIAVSRKNYNDQVAAYNKKIKMFPNSIIANMFGHSQGQYLKASEAEKTTPNVSF